jgi:hypothetical protein
MHRINSKKINRSGSIEHLVLRRVNTSQAVLLILKVKKKKDSRNNTRESLKKLKNS